LLGRALCGGALAMRRKLKSADNGGHQQSSDDR
jgi:hypothetical protein